MTKKSIETLLKKYPPHKKGIGEIWSKESDTKYKQQYRTKQRLRLFDCLNNQCLKLKGNSKAQVKHHIINLDFGRFSRLNEEQIIIMIMLYVKLKEGRWYQQYSYILPKYDLNHSTFINFIVKLHAPLFNSPNEE